MPHSEHQPVDDAYVILEDSAYDLLGDTSSFASDDDDVHTESITSNDDVLVDDVRSIADSNFDSQSQRFDQDCEPQDSCPDIRIPDRPSDLHRSSSISSSSEGNEPNRQIDERTQVRDESWQSMPTALRSPHRHGVTLQQPISSHRLRLGNQFRVLIVGDFQRSQDLILQKLASALSLSIESQVDDVSGPNGSQRYNIVPVSAFADHRSFSDVELIDASTIDLLLDVCTDILPLETRGQSAGQGVVLILNHQTPLHLTIPGRSSASKDEMPDLIIFYHSENAREALKLKDLSPSSTRRCIRGLALAQGIGALDISENDLSLGSISEFQAAPYQMHLSVEENSDPEKSTHYPIPLGLFLELDSDALNRHLAFIIENSRVKGDAIREPTRTHLSLNSKSTNRHLPKSNVMRKLSGHPKSSLLYDLRFLLFGALLVVMFFGSLEHFRHKSDRSLLQQSRSSNVDGTRVATVRGTASTNLVSHATERGSSNFQKSAWAASKGHETPNNSLTRNYANILSSRVSTEDRINIGDPHGFFTSSFNFTSMRNPQLLKEVRRSSGELSTKVAHLFDGANFPRIESPNILRKLGNSIRTGYRPSIYRKLFLKASPYRIEEIGRTIQIQRLSSKFVGDLGLGSWDLGGIISRASNWSTQLTASFREKVQDFLSSKTSSLARFGTKYLSPRSIYDGLSLQAYYFKRTSLSALGQAERWSREDGVVQARRLANGAWQTRFMKRARARARVICGKAPRKIPG